MKQGHCSFVICTKNEGKNKLITHISAAPQDIKEGTGQPIEEGQTAVVDWDGYTIGYYGRPFEARNKVSVS